ncbi:uncharacterized protein LOC118190989 [Stegodyphus dumicola]|uniref:uncharacterized protein LOC118190989 n=1 Tax=Stegodyphus dumicola TaxID=202533 RepID=UPI0015B1969F|nr:uncharacterized protein LOC118190989 [Stegodyphus dumicola]
MFWLALFVFASSTVSNGYGDCQAAKYLVTMGEDELLETVECVSKSEDPLVCKKFAVCEKLMAPRIQFTLEDCRKELAAEEPKKCSSSSIIFETPEVQNKIFECVAEKVEKLTFPEKKIMFNFEECAKMLAEDHCEKEEG